MYKLTTIPNLLDLVKNPFLLTLALEALPNVTEGKKDLSAVLVTRVQLYDIFVVHWLDVNKRRLESSSLTAHERAALDQLLEEILSGWASTFQCDWSRRSLKSRTVTLWSSMSTSRTKSCGEESSLVQTKDPHVAGVIAFDSYRQPVPVSSPIHPGILFLPYLLQSQYSTRQR